MIKTAGWRRPLAGLLAVLLAAASVSWNSFAQEEPGPAAPPGQTVSDKEQEPGGEETPGPAEETPDGEKPPAGEEDSEPEQPEQPPENALPGGEEPTAGESGLAPGQSSPAGPEEETPPEETRAPCLALRWQQTGGGQVRLTAELSHAEGDAAAEVSIQLTEEQAAALSDPLPEGLQLEGDALRLGLDAGSPQWEGLLAFEGEALSLQVEEAAVSVDFSGLEGPEGEWNFVCEAIEPEEEWSLEARTAQDEVAWSWQQPEDLTFTLAIEAPEEPAESGRQLEASLALPEGFAFPDGQPRWEGDTLYLGETAVLLLEGLPQGADAAALPQQDSLALSLAWQDDSPVRQLHLTLVGSALQQSQTAALRPAARLAAAAAQQEPPALPVTLSVRLTAGETVRTASASASLRLSEEMEITSYHPSWDQRLYWVDHSDEAGLRPQAGELAVQLSFRITEQGAEPAGDYTPLTEETMAQLGLDTLPAGTFVEALSGGAWLYRVQGGLLPTAYTVTDLYGDRRSYTVEWQMTPPQAEGYALVEVTDGNLADYPSVETPGWYYLLEETKTFRITVRQGGQAVSQQLLDALLSQFQLRVQYQGAGETDALWTLSELPEENVSISVQGAEITLQVSGAWKYNLDSSSIIYLLEEISRNDRLEFAGLEEGDRLEITYNNAGSDHYGTAADALYPGGMMYLTLAGERQYEATKVWLDEGDEAARPEAELQLWRYRVGQSYETAAPMRGADGNIITLRLDTDKDTEQVVFTGSDGSPLQLPKYDAEGYRYLYVAREYLYGSGYEQVFGRVEEDAVVDRVVVDGQLVDTSDPADRQEGDTFLYNGGTLSNRRAGTLTTQVTKTWDAAAFQSQFQDVRVQLGLFARPAGSQGQWEDTGESVEMSDFSSENLSGQATRVVQRFDRYGRELEYTWQETGVWQGEGGENLLQEDGSFTLEQGGVQVRYYSHAEPDGDGVQVINTIDNRTEYHLTKVWLDGNGEETAPPEGVSVSFQLLRLLGGEPAGENPAAVFTLDGIPDEQAQELDGGIFYQETAPWQARITGLAAFELGTGREYEYLLLEGEGAAGFFPSYETVKTEDGYFDTTVYNGPGGGNRIMVRKQWIDDSDSLHRLPVTFTVYSRADHSVVGTVTLQDGVWYTSVGIGTLTPEEVYVLETQVGGHTVPYPGGGEGPAPPDYYSEENAYAYTAVQYETDYHRYEVVYTCEEIAGETFYTAINRRLGNIDLTVTKRWTDGDRGIRQAVQNELDFLANKYALALRLEFAEGTQENYYTITNNAPEVEGDKITIGSLDNWVQIEDENGDPAFRVQAIDFEADESEYYFHHLPKYNLEGVVAHYTIREVWINTATNQEVALEKILTASEKARTAAGLEDPDLLRQLLAEYTSRVEETSYEVADDSLYAQDLQEITVYNTLSGQKSVTWHKYWRDAYIYENGQRPDIYLDIYQRIHLDDTETATSVYRENYRWTYTDLGDQTDPETRWDAVITGLPKYDSLGYEIEYFAVEHSQIHAADFDYQEVGYSYEGRPLGTPSQAQGQAALEYLENIGTAEEPQYALIEGGTFTNAIADTVTISGQKRWRNLPAGYPQEDLPQVTFTLTRTLAGGGADPDPMPPTTLTIRPEDWEKLYSGGDYAFLMQYEGENTLTVDADGQLVCSGEANADLLPRYDSDGRLYEYTLTETVTLSDGTGTTVTRGDVYDEPDIDSYLAVNHYHGSPTGILTVKKLFDLPRKAGGDPASYPAIQLELSRVYTTEEGADSAPQVVNTLVWDSTEVQRAWEEASASGKITLEHLFVFEDLELYAPNGQPYRYQVREVKEDYLEGFNTWAAEGDRTKEHLTGLGQSDTVPGLTPVQLSQGGGTQAVTPAATFYNAPRPDGVDKVNLTGQKIWVDWGDVLGLRPDKLQLKLYRSAPSQPGQNNGITEHEVPLQSGDPDSRYFVAWSDTGTDTWTYTITGLERYAANGQEWDYVIEEVRSKTPVDKDDTLPHYAVTPGTGRVSVQRTEEDAAGGGATLYMHHLTNSLAVEAPYAKSWVDENGQILTEDYLGVPLRVELQLQVGVVHGGNNITWYDADEYFTNMYEDHYKPIFGEDYAFTATLEGELDSGVWGRQNAFEGLPARLVAGGERLYYRVVETKVSYGSAEQTYTLHNRPDGRSYTYETSGMIQPHYPDGEGAGYALEDTQLYNRIDTVRLTAEKQWQGDHDDAYGTRPPSGRSGYDWEVSFAVQRRIDGGYWQTVTDGRGSPLLLYGYGGAADESAQTGSVTGLPAQDEDGQTYEYRAVELEPREDPQHWHGSVTAAEVEAALVKAKETYHTAYTAGYGDSFTAVNTLETITLTALKRWVGASTPVTLELQYLAEDGSWKPFAAPARITLNGQADASHTLPYYEREPQQDGAWTAVWEGVPRVMPGSQVDEDGRTRYRVRETALSGYLPVQPQEFAAGQTQVEFQNVESTRLTVQKTWGSSTIPASVTVGLYRTTDPGQVGQNLEANRVLNASDEPQTLTLTAAGSWRGAFENLPKYSGGQLYYYYALETAIGGEPVEEVSSRWQIVYSHPEKEALEAETAAVEILNIGLRDFTVEKHWLDGHNAYDTRPDDLQVTLYRQVSGGQPEVVTAQPGSWQKPAGSDYWRRSWSGLPESDQEGRLYRYWAEETAPASLPGGDRYEPTAPADHHLHNLLTGTLDLPVEKLWRDNGGAFGQRPGQVIIRLYADGADTGRTLTLTEAGGWQGTFEDLEKYDGEGVRIQYTVAEETIPAGYECAVTGDMEEGYTVTNTGTGSLEVSKTVTGSRGDRTMEFPFTLTLLDGPGGAALTEEYPYEITRQDGTTATGLLASGGSFTLRHGERFTLTGLKDGTWYQAAETAHAGYQLTSQGETGSIQAGVVARAAFTNYRGSSGGGGGDDWVHPADRDPGGDGAPEGEDPPAVEETAPPRELPHTGQNWLLPALLALGGLLACGYGLYLRRKPHDDA